MFMLLNVKILLNQIVENLPQKAPEIVRFPKTFEFLVFFEKIDGILGKKLEIFKNFQRCQIYGRMRIKRYSFLKMLLPP